MTIPFETFVLDPDPWMKKIEKICVKINLQKSCLRL